MRQFAKNLVPFATLLLLLCCSSGSNNPASQPNPTPEPEPGPGTGGTTSSFQLVQLGHLNPLDLDPDSEIYQGVSGWLAPDGSEYALLTSSRGFLVIDVTVPSEPTMIQQVPLHGGSVHRDVAVYQHYAYVGGQQGAVTQVFDLSYLPDNPPRVHTIVPSVEYSHTLNIANGLLFLNSARGVCRIYSLDNPRIPGLISNVTHDDCHDSFVRGSLMVSAGGRSRVFTLVDISDPVNPIILGQTPGFGGIYAHSAWTNEDNTLLFGFEEYGALDIMIFDISDKTDPFLITSFSLPEETRVHNGVVRDDLLYLAYYESGFVVLDVSDPTQPQIKAQAKTWPGEPMNAYDGAWNLSMNLPSGKILVSDTGGGLFIFEANP